MTASVCDLELGPQVDVRGDAPPGFPRTPNKTAGIDGRTVLWLGPDEWLVLGGVESDFRGALAAVDVSANRIALQITGQGAGELLAQGCALDLHETRFQVGDCAQTLLARVEVVLYRTAPDTFVVLVRPSFGPYLRAWLADASLGLESQT